jgi:hypothetical protein
LPGEIQRRCDFSANLLNLFLQTLPQSGHEPRAILMVNSGVKLMDPDGPYIKAIKWAEKE